MLGGVLICYYIMSFFVPFSIPPFCSGRLLKVLISRSGICFIIFIFVFCLFQLFSKNRTKLKKKKEGTRHMCNFFPFLSLFFYHHPFSSQDSTRGYLYFFPRLLFLYRAGSDGRSVLPIVLLLYYLLRSPSCHILFSRVRFFTSILCFLTNHASG
ncbi:hypothetical protein EDC01DRAFT_213628 [Geopyxis carbonaria]|nr:hypothetical protein EDC01DRAFT_213628 [Geopyxis carbonaria]